MQVSVVIPVFNSAASIEQALESVLSQTVLPAEIVVVDDGSTDSTREVVERFGAPVRCIAQANRGVAAARNRGVRESGGEWIAFLDADDTWEPVKLERQLSLLARHPQVTWLSCGYIQHDLRRNERRVRVWPTDAEDLVFEDALPALATEYLVHTDTLLVSRELFDRVGGYDEKLEMGEDVDLWVRLAVASPSLGFVNRPLATYFCANTASFSQGWAVRGISPAPVLRSLAATLEQAPPTSAEAGRQFVTHVFVGILSTVLGRAPSAHACEYLREIRRNGFGPLPLWMRICAALPLPASRLLRHLYARFSSSI